MSNQLATERIQKHFENIALELDWWEQRNH
ncbi:MAG: hypothetical protein RLZZ135_1316, partial [Cyanobacteriota bacterium]